jgi:hypothetical protein
VLVNDLVLGQSVAASTSNEIHVRRDYSNPLLPGTSDDERESLARSVRRLVLGSLIDREVDLQMIRADLRVLIEARVVSLAASPAA